jgi:hypothetical protein
VIDTDRPDWWDRAACRGRDPRWWFPEGVENADRPIGGKRTVPLVEYAPHAIRVCAVCPASDDCLAYALTVNVDGVWAGTSPYTRHQIRSAAGIRPAPVTAPDLRIEQGEPA